MSLRDEVMEVVELVSDVQSSISKIWDIIDSIQDQISKANDDIFTLKCRYMESMRCLGETHKVIRHALNEHYEKYGPEKYTKISEALDELMKMAQDAETGKGLFPDRD